VGVSRPQEPQLIAEAVKRLGLRYAVITSVTRDDLADGGAGIFAETIQEIRKSNRVIRIEALIPDFQGSEISLETVVKARPDVIGHNIETVKRLYCEVRPEADYQRSLGVLKTVKCLDSKITTKSSLMLGMGEVEAEVVKAMEDLRASDCDILTLGQYLPPSDKHYPVKDFIALEQFAKYKEAAMAMGFRVILSGPLVRSSYKAEEVYQTCMT
jgi:lipoic acid synthetase